MMLTASVRVGAQDVPDDLDIYLCIGQSNMAGRGSVPSDATGDMEGVCLLNSDGAFEVARNPLNRYSTVRKDLANQRMSIAWGFAKTMHERTNRPVGLVVNARGETGIAQWQKGTSITFTYEQMDGTKTSVTRSLYAEAVSRTREAMKHGTLRGIIWHQGEYDCKTTDFTQYKAQLQKLVNDLRTDLDCPDVPFVAGQISRWNWTGTEAGTEPFNEFIMTVNTFISHAACASSEGLTPWLSSGNDPHFSGASQKTFGERYAAKMTGLQTGEDVVDPIDDPKPGDGGGSLVDLTSDMYHVWDGVGADAQPTSATPYFQMNLGTEMKGGGVIYGNSNVRSLQYADLTGFGKLLMEGSAGSTLRVIMNREINEGAVTEVRATFNDEGQTEVYLSGYEYAHLNCIKVANGGTATVTKLQLHKADDTVGVSQIENRKSVNSKFYDLQGRRVASPKKGLYIYKGHKILVR